MTRIPLPIEDDFFSNSSINHALIAVAQEVSELLQQTYPVQADGIDDIETIIQNRNDENNNA